MLNVASFHPYLLQLAACIDTTDSSLMVIHWNWAVLIQLIHNQNSSNINIITVSIEKFKHFLTQSRAKTHISLCSAVPQLPIPTYSKESKQ